MLRDAELWFADGTFDCAPEGYQLYTRHMLINQSNKTISLVYCILKNKDAITYNRVLELLMKRRVVNPHSILVDFENASINVLRVFSRCRPPRMLISFWAMYMEESTSIGATSMVYGG